MGLKYCISWSTQQPIDEDEHSLQVSHDDIVGLHDVHPHHLYELYLSYTLALLYGFNVDIQFHM